MGLLLLIPKIYYRFLLSHFLITFEVIKNIVYLYGKTDKLHVRFSDNRTFCTLKLLIKIISLEILTDSSETQCCKSDAVPWLKAQKRAGTSI